MRRWDCLLVICLCGAIGVGCTSSEEGGNGTIVVVNPESDAGDKGAPQDAGTSGAPDGAVDDTGAAPDVADASARTDADTDNDGEAVDTGPECTTDSDGDGISDCDEREACTDPHDGDTDGDGLGDLEERQKQTDPCESDTDNDGASDKEELDMGLDPTRPSTYGDGVSDGERWRLQACEDPSAEPVDFHKNTVGNWTIALPPAFSNYAEVQFENASRPMAAAVYGDPANEVSGALLSKQRDGIAIDPSDTLRDTIQGALGRTGELVQDQTGADFDTHDRKTAAVGRYLVETEEAKSIRKLRQEVLLNLVPFGAGRLSGLPHTEGTTYNRFRVFVSVVFRQTQQGIRQSLISLAIAPNEKFEMLENVRFRMNDLTNTTNVAEQVDTHLTRCNRFQSGEKTPKTEFYWVLDQSGSMRDDNQKVADFAQKFVNQINNTSLDYRLGVTNMDRQNHGRLRVPPGWHTDSETFRQEIEEAVIGCQQGGSWACNAGLEHGLVAAQEGIEYMTGQTSSTPASAERVRSDAEIVTIFMADEEANSIKRRNKTTQHFTEFFKDRTTAFSIVADGYHAGCPSEDGEAYKEVALATGGKFASLCAEDLTQTIRDIIFASTGLSSNYTLPQTPISSSLRVYLNDTWVPRNRTNGFEYFAENNSIAFFGNYRPTPQDQNSEGPDDFVVVTYETFKDRCKDASSDECRPSPE